MPANMPTTVKNICVKAGPIVFRPDGTWCLDIVGDSADIPSLGGGGSSGPHNHTTADILNLDHILTGLVQADADLAAPANATRAGLVIPTGNISVTGSGAIDVDLSGYVLANSPTPYDLQIGMARVHLSDTAFSLDMQGGIGFGITLSDQRLQTLGGDFYALQKDIEDNFVQWPIAVADGQVLFYNQVADDWVADYLPIANRTVHGMVVPTGNITVNGFGEIDVVIPTGGGSANLTGYVREANTGATEIQADGGVTLKYNDYSALTVDGAIRGKGDAVFTTVGGYPEPTRGATLDIGESVMLKSVPRTGPADASGLSVTFSDVAGVVKPRVVLQNWQQCEWLDESVLCQGRADARYVQLTPGVNYTTANITRTPTSNAPLHGLHWFKTGGLTELSSGAGMMDDGTVRLGTSYATRNNGPLKSVSAVYTGAQNSISMTTTNFDTAGNQTMIGTLSAGASGPTMQISLPDDAGTTRNSMVRIMGMTGVSGTPLTGNVARVDLIVERETNGQIVFAANATNTYFGRTATSTKFINDANSYLTQGDCDTRYAAKPATVFTGTFTTQDGKTVTVENGVIKSVV